MCRWLAYFDDPIPIEWVVLQPKYSLLDQSLHARLGATTTNGDGFGLGWYGTGGQPSLFRSVHPAWNDRNLRDLVTVSGVRQAIEAVGAQLLYLPPY